jgi:hypothetical protein
MFRRFTRAWPWKIGLIVFALLFAWNWWSTQPLATLKLPDGTKVLLQKITVGKIHPYKTSLPPNSTAWEHVRHLFAKPNGNITFSEPSPVFHFAAGSISGAGTNFPIDAIRTFWGGDRVIEANIRSTTDLAFWTHPVFPRRQKTFRAQVKSNGSWYDWELPNPTYGQAFPVWTAEALPLKRTFGDLEYTALGWKHGQYGWHLRYELRYRGKRVDWPVVSGSSTILSDPGGNQSFKPLSSDEPAWKVRQEITTGMQSPLSPDHVIPVGPFRIPEPSVQIMQVAPPNLPGPGKRFVGFVGAGPYCFADGEAVTPSAKTSGSDRSNLRIAPGGKSWWLSGQANAPTFLLVEDVPPDAPEIYSSQFEFQYLKGQEAKRAGASGFSEQAHGRHLRVRSYTINEAPGTNIEIQFFRRETFTVEMFLKPPPVEPAIPPPNSGARP